MPTNKKGYMADYYHKNKNKFNNATEKKKRAARNKARRMMEKAGRVRKGDNLDVHHIRSLKNGGSTTKANLRVVSRSKNRANK